MRARFRLVCVTSLVGVHEATNDGDFVSARMRLQKLLLLLACFSGHSAPYVSGRNARFAYGWRSIAVRFSGQVRVH